MPSPSRIPNIDRRLGITRHMGVFAALFVVIVLGVAGLTWGIGQTAKENNAKRFYDPPKISDFQTDATYRIVEIKRVQELDMVHVFVKRSDGKMFAAMASPSLTLVKGNSVRLVYVQFSLNVIGDARLFVAVAR